MIARDTSKITPQQSESITALLRRLIEAIEQGVISEPSELGVVAGEIGELLSDDGEWEFYQGFIGERSLSESQIRFFEIENQ